MRTVPRAFTISEVIITALVALILTAMAIPQFSTGASAGTDGLAQISVSQAAAAETNYFTGAQAYTSSLTDLTNIDSSISYVASPTPSSSTTVVSVDLASATVVGLAALGANDTCWLERLSLNPASANDGPILYGSLPADVSNPCTGAAAAALNVNPAFFVSAATGLAWTNPVLLP